MLKAIFTLGGAVAVLASCAVPSKAFVIIFGGNTPGGNNVLFNNNPPDGTTVDGRVNQVTDYNAYFQSTATLHGNGGQARVEDALGNDLTNVLFYLDAPYAFTQYVFNPFNGNGNATLHVVATYQDDVLGPLLTEEADFAIGNGNNFTTVQAQGGSFIRSVALSVNQGGWTDLRQNRVYGVFDPETGEPPASIPEPGSLALLLGAAVSGLVVVRKRR